MFTAVKEGKEGKCSTCAVQELTQYTKTCCIGCELIEQQAIRIARLLLDAEQVFGGEV